MAITVPDQGMTAEPPLILPIARQYEAASFRAWPALSSTYDGAWITRLTPGHPSRRLNSVNMLDPGDAADISERVAKARKVFADASVPLAFRLTPLSAPAVKDYLDTEGWRTEAESVVMRADLAHLPADDSIDQIPLKDIERFIAAASAVRGVHDGRWPVLAKVIASIQPEAGLFVGEQDGAPVASTICVHEGALAGLFDLVTAQPQRGHGHGRRMVVSALKWARLRGARYGWLQVEADNRAAMSLYTKLGFTELYRYAIRVPRD
jgi:GNAT superfamily N-acetyltransferase